MTSSDPIADMLTRVRNAYQARHNEVEFPYSRVNEAIAKILARVGFLGKIEVRERPPQSVLRAELLYRGQTPAVEGIERLSKPGRRLYARAGKLPTALGGYGVVIVSTHKGIMTAAEARKQHLGGELICKIW